MSGGLEDRPDAEAYALKAGATAEFAAPDLPYQPPAPRGRVPRIALIGAGGIAGAHLDAYRAAGWPLATICNRSRARAEARAAEFFPQAHVTDNWEEVLADPSIGVVDITPHPADRRPIIEAALKAGKHVLSQKPFVEDLETGKALVRLAHDRGVKLAVNQNGRWAPHLAWMREATRAGYIGTLTTAHAAINWDHGWIARTPFNEVPDLLLFDFGVHWFDFLASLAGDRLESVHATSTRAPAQAARPPLLAQALVRLTDGQASLVFDGASTHGPGDVTLLTGTGGTLVAQGPDLGHQRVTLTTAAGRASPALEGRWFNDGFRGAMGELLCAIEDNRRPENDAEGNLQSLALTFAALASARERREVAIGSVRSRHG